MTDKTYIERKMELKLKAATVDTLDWDEVVRLFKEEGGYFAVETHKFTPKSIDNDLVFSRYTDLTPAQIWESIKWLSQLPLSDLRNRQAIGLEEIDRANKMNKGHATFDDIQLKLEVLSHAISLSQFGQLNFMIGD